MLWVYIVAAMIMSLVLIELVASARRKRSPELELAGDSAQSQPGIERVRPRHPSSRIPAVP